MSLAPSLPCSLFVAVSPYVIARHTVGPFLNTSLRGLGMSAVPHTSLRGPSGTWQSVLRNRSTYSVELQLFTCLSCLPCHAGQIAILLVVKRLCGTLSPYASLRYLEVCRYPIRHCRTLVCPPYPIRHCEDRQGRGNLFSETVLPILLNFSCLRVCPAFLAMQDKLPSCW